MKETDNIKELFSGKLGNHETPVPPEIWQTVQSGIGVSTGSVGISLLGKSLLFIGVTVAAVATVVIITTANNNPSKPKNDSENIVLTNKTTADRNIPNKEQKEEVILNEKKPVNNAVEPVDNKILNLSNERLMGPGNRDVDQRTVVDQPENHRLLPVVLNDVDENRVEQNERGDENSTVENDQVADDSQMEIQEKDDLYLPDIFTPNGDGSNDEFFVKSNGLSDFSLVVMDEKNKTIYSTSDPAFTWNGFDLSGNAAPVGNYIYILTAKDEKGNLISKYSRLRIQR